MKRRRKYRRRKRNQKPSVFKKWAKRFGLFCLVLILIFTIFGFIFNWMTAIKEPLPQNIAALELKRETVGHNYYKIGNNWLRKSKSDLWEMYIEGEAFERGVVHGKLSKELFRRQEDAFVSQIRKMIPSDFVLRFLKYGISWFNRDLDEHIPLEYQLEIYGVSQVAATDYDFIAPSYKRILNYHAAHDIGHALQDMSVVACTSFSAWGEQSVDSTLIVGRNFDFYVGDDFAKDKIVLFINPDKGHKHSFVTWSGFIGAVSGINEHGITVTLNAAKSEMPTKAATPISILAREILQYASNIEEALNIAKKHDIFVSESLMVGSAADNKTILIEKTPTKTATYESPENKLICTNHYQSDSLKNTATNLDNIENTDSDYRFKRVAELMAQDTAMSVVSAAAILRNQQGLGGKDIGMGNEKAINQLIAHHSVIFKPQQRQFWVSSAPWQLGAYMGYDLGYVFSDTLLVNATVEIIDSSLTIPADPFLSSTEYTKYLIFRELKEGIESAMSIDPPLELREGFILDFTTNNPNYYLGYALIGDYFRKRGDCKESIAYYKKALELEIPKVAERSRIEECIAECEIDNHN